MWHEYSSVEIKIGLAVKKHHSLEGFEIVVDDTESKIAEMFNTKSEKMKD